MSEITIDAGTLTFSGEDRTASGRLVPYGVEAKSNLGRFTFADGDIGIPADVTGMSVNVEHKREDVVGAFSKVWSQEDGVYFSLKFADTDEGRAAYADAQNGKRKHLSAEVSHVRIKDGKALPGARLFAAALVERPAFEGATLLAAEDTPFAEEEPVELPAEANPEVTAEAVPESITVTTPEGEQVTFTPDAAPAEESETDTTTQEFSMSDNTNAGAVPATLLASAPTAKPVDIGTVFASIASIKANAADAADAETLLGTLADIKVNATGGLTKANDGVIQPSWVGQLWQGKSYVQKFIDLGTRAYGGISLGGRKGFVLDQGTALVQHWNGNKTELPTGSGTTSVKTASRRQYGYGADYAREWWDLDGGAEVIEAFIRGVVDSYAKIVDQDALADIMATALPNLAAPGTYPSQYPNTLGMLIDAVEAVQDADDDPSFILVNPTAWRELIQTPKDLVPEFVSFDFKTGGEGTADGKVRVRKAPAAAFKGTDPLKPAVVAGAQQGIEFREQGSTPIKLDALDIARGGIDRAVVGYMETFVVRPESFVAFGTAKA